MDRALAFCEVRAFERVSRWTVEGLDAVRHLDESHGFSLVEAHSGRDWGRK